MSVQLAWAGLWGHIVGTQHAFCAWMTQWMNDLKRFLAMRCSLQRWRWKSSSLGYSLRDSTTQGSPLRKPLRLLPRVRRGREESVPPSPARGREAGQERQCRKFWEPRIPRLGSEREGSPSGEQPPLTDGDDEIYHLRASWGTLALNRMSASCPVTPGITDSSKMPIINPIVHAFAPGEDNLLLAQDGVPKIKTGKFPAGDDDSELTRTVPEGQDTGFQLLVCSALFRPEETTLSFYRWFPLGWVWCTHILPYFDQTLVGFIQYYSFIIYMYSYILFIPSFYTWEHWVLERYYSANQSRSQDFTRPIWLWNLNFTYQPLKLSQSAAALAFRRSSDSSYRSDMWNKEISHL